MAAFVEQLKAELRDWAAVVVETAKQDVLDSLDDNVPVDTGELRASRIVSDRDLGFTVEYPTDVANFTNDGTAAHPILGDPLLAFDVGGTTVIVRSVDHPGTEGTHWFDDQVNQVAWTESLASAASGTPGLG